MRITDFSDHAGGDLPYQKKLASEQAQMRQHHYAFVRTLFAALAFRSGASWIPRWRTEEGLESLQQVWQLAAYNVPEDQRVEGAALRSFVHRRDDYIYVVVVMPEPLYSPEAYYVVLAFGPLPDFATVTACAMSRADKLERFNEAFAAMPMRYLTVERTITEECVPGSVLGEWTQAGDHLYHGCGPIPAEDMVVAAVASMIGKLEA